ncbi:MAG: hypothetical protein COA96_15435 [SAR86 cluster bacterium]|uniref:Organic solvent tolerance-like N-terminal domain-containing protein n=1 Tax=SAR86 cluster bacterium TaxID=2030880 RepID=A0A2A5ANY8_9GAMM|nr:MAG: hypothetical protein COA96_15435 [SAR86 cluster bacterium]
MSKRPIRTFKHCMLTVCTFMLLPYASLALDSDKEQGVTWEADGDSSMKIVGDLRILEMSKNVRVTQGTLEILGDEATFEHSVITGELKKVTVRGNPVQYQQQLNDEGGIVVGSSRTLSFFTDEIDGNTILELVGEASIKSPDSTMKCSAITYVVDQDLIREAVGPCAGALSPTAN